MKKIRISCASAGCAYERLEPALEVLEKGELDYIVFECLAERTIADSQLEKQQNPDKGYNPMLEERMRAVLPLAVKHGVKIISNMGAANPPAAVAKIASIARELGIKGLKVAMVQGDDFSDFTRYYRDNHLWDSDRTLRSIADNIVSANIYLSGEPIRQALDQGADIVITGRVADTSLFVGPLKHEFGWDDQAPRQLGQAILLGHLMECANQLTGGYFADPGYNDVPEPHRLGFPIAEIDESGVFEISKVEGSGGLVCVDICKEQLLYEIDNPAHFITPDGIADFSHVTFEQAGPDRVIARNARSYPAPDTCKVNIGYRGGFEGEGRISYGGSNALARARLAAEIVQKRLELIGVELDEVRVDYIGYNSLYGDTIADTLAPQPPAEVRMRIAGRSATREPVAQLVREVECLYTNGPAGGGGIRFRIDPVISMENILIPRSDVSPTVELFEV